MKNLATGLLCMLLASWLARQEPRLPPDRLWGVCGSLWGAFVAECMRPGLHRLWHAGREQHGPRLSRLSSKAPPRESLGQAALRADTVSPPSPALLRHSLGLAQSRLHTALLLSPSDWVLLDIALESAKTGLKTDAEGTWGRMLTLAGPALRPPPDGRPSLAQSVAAATACASFCEMAMASHRPDGQVWLASLRLHLQRCETLLAEAYRSGELQSLSPARTEDLLTQISLLQRLGDSYPKS